MIPRLLLLLSLTLLMPAGWSAIDAYEFDSEVDRKRFQSLVENMRCPKCENQNLSGSDSPIAGDLRREVYMMIQDGRSDGEIIDHMVDRYGEYVLYRPQLKATTLVLWFGPAVLLLVGIIALLVMLRQRRRYSVYREDLTSEEQARLQELLNARKTEGRS